MGKLTKAQRAALEWLYVDGSPRRLKGMPGEPSLNIVRGLVSMGLVRRSFRGPMLNNFCFTDAGRAALEDNAAAIRKGTP